MRSPLFALLVSGCLLGLPSAARAAEQEPAPAPTTDRVVTAVRVSLLTSQIFDLSTTTYGIGAGVVSEANPLMRWAADEPIALASMKLGTVAALDWSVRALMRRGRRKTAIALGVGLAASTFVVSMHNMKEIRRAQGR